MLYLTVMVLANYSRSVVLPAEAQVRPMTPSSESLQQIFQSVRKRGTQNSEKKDRMLCLHNRTWSAGRASNLKHFNGRANETSVKNFQLCVSPPEDKHLYGAFMESELGKRELIHPERVVLQLGRVDDRFNVDFTYPMSFFTAFGICLSRFATKATEDY